MRGLIAGALAALIACTLYFFQVFEALEYQLYDRNIRSSATRQAPANIVIVAVDQPSLERLGSWPWPRAFHAEVVRQIHRNGAKVIGVDIGFFEPDRREPDNDAQLVDATREAGSVIYPVIMEGIVEDGVTNMWAFEPIPDLRAVAAGVGHAHIEQSTDGIVRRVHLAYKTRERTYWGLNLEILKHYLDVPDDGIRRVRPGVLAIGDIEVPIIEAPESLEAQLVGDYEMNIAYVGDQGTFEYISANDLIDGTVPTNYFDGKIVLYGGNAAGLFDTHMTPFSLDRSPTAGVEIQANVIHAILQSQHIQRAPLWVLAVFTTLCAMAVAAIYLYFDTRLATLSLVLLSGGAFGAQTFLFKNYGTWIEVSPLVVALIIAFIFGLMLKMRHVNVALDREVMSLSLAAALNERAGEKVIIETFRAAEATLREVLGFPAAALLKMERNKGLLIPTAQYGLTRLNPNQPAKIKLTGDLTSLLISLEPIQIDGLQHHPLAAIVPRPQLASYHAQVVPLVSKGETVGALCLFKSRGDEFPIQDQDLLQAVSAEFGAIWYNAALYARLTEKSVNPLATFTYKNQERRIQTLSALNDAVVSEKSLMASIMDSIADGVLVTDVLGTIQILNPKAKEILGLYAESAIGQSAVEFIQRFDDVPYDVMHEKFQKIIERGETFRTDIKLSLPTTRFYTLSLGPVRSKDGLVQGIVAVLSDITQLKEMDQMKTDLMSMVTHEIRTPLATVRGFAQILLKGGIGNEKSSEFLEIINRQSNRLVNLVNDFLDITRIESGRQVVTKGPVDLDKLIKNAVADLKPLADEKNISLQYQQLPTPIPEIFGDRNLVEQVLINLLSNAIKYSPKGAWARVSVAQRNGHMAVSVQDNGLGIPKESVSRLFEKFYRVRNDDRKDIIGTGLGLSLAKQIIDVHGGTISVESEHGEGSKFTFTIPIHREGMAPVTATTTSHMESAAVLTN
jgi:two-component system phosphate regulon sensor histidine kinase PhoR